MKTNFLSDSRILWALGLLIIAVYIPGLFVPLMDNDSAHHASIGLHMYLTGNYAFLIDQGQAYLDKPHLLFWLSALSYHIFGVTTFAFKFPSFLFTILCVYSTYRLASLLYNKDTGKLAALILASSCAFVLSNNDVRMEAVLTGSMAFAIWQLCEYTYGRRFLNLVLAALGLALGFSTKGMIGVVIPAVAIFFHLLYRRDWKMIFHWKWLLLVVFFAIFISPVVYCYYLQFDLHPETSVRGVNHISGVKFILWNQNIERMKGEGHTQNRKDFFFYFHTFLWAFLPWSLLSAVAVGSRMKALFKSQFRSIRNFDFLTTGTLIFFMIFFSSSKFKLPHYLNCLFPLFAVLLAGYLLEKYEQKSRFKMIWYIQLVSLILTVVVALVLNLWAFPVTKPAVAAVLFLLAVIWLTTFFIKGRLFYRTLVFTFLGGVFIFASLNMNFYPQLLTYQAGNQLAFAAKDLKIDPQRVKYFLVDDFSFTYDFYTAWEHEAIDKPTLDALIRRKEETWLFTTEEGKSYLEQNNVPFSKIFVNKDYRVSVIKPAFLNPHTRPGTLSEVYLIKIF